MTTLPVDEGRAPERTALAWQRTGLAVVFAGVAVLRLAVVRGSVAGVAAGLLAMLTAAVVLARVRLGGRGTAVDGPTVPMGPAALTAVSIALLGFAAVSVELS